MKHLSLIILATFLFVSALSCDNSEKNKKDPDAKQVEAQKSYNKTYYISDRFGVEYFDYSYEKWKLGGLLPYGAEFIVSVNENGEYFKNRKLPGFIKGTSKSEKNIYVRENQLSEHPPRSNTDGWAVCGDIIFTYPVAGAYNIGMSYDWQKYMVLEFSITSANSIRIRDFVPYEESDLISEKNTKYPMGLREHRTIGKNKDIEVLILNTVRPPSYNPNDGTTVDIIIASPENHFNFIAYAPELQSMPLFNKIAASMEKVPLKDLYRAVEENNTEEAERILNPEKPVSDFRKKIMPYLLSQYLDLENTTLLYRAIEKENFAMVKLLVENGADLEKGIIELEGEISPLFAAIKNRDENTTRFLVEKGAQKNRIMPGGETILNYAVKKRDVAMVRLALDLGMNPNTFDAEDESPLSLSILYKKSEYENLDMDEIEILQLLLESGADPNLKDNTNKSALDRAEKSEAKDIYYILKDFKGKDSALKEPVTPESNK